MLKSPENYEEYLHFPQWVGWILIVALSAAVIGFGMVLHVTIPELPRQWDFGATPDVPAESIYSTRPSPTPPDKQASPAQVAPLPEGVPWDRQAQQPRSILLERP